MTHRRRIPRTNVALAVAYIRVSTDEQSLGPKAQRNAIERWAKARGVTIAGWHEDRGVSGAAPLEKRPGLMAALATADAQAAGLIVVAKRDRLARDVVVAAMIERLAERQGARVTCADGSCDQDGPEGALMRGVVDVFAQYERAVIRARTKAALAQKKARAELVGSVPFGSRLASDGRTLEADADEQATIARIRQLRSEGLSLRAVVERLNADKVPCRGAQWHLTTVARLLRREQEAA